MAFQPATALHVLNFAAWAMDIYAVLLGFVRLHTSPRGSVASQMLRLGLLRFDRAMTGHGGWPLLDGTNGRS